MKSNMKPEMNLDTDKRNKLLRYSCLFLGVLMIAIGIALGQPEQIFQQAIRICLECIGIG